MTKKKILFLHQGGELYGSDRVFAEVVRQASALVLPIVVLSSGGPLTGMLESFGARVIVRELGMLRRKYLSVSGFFKLLAWNIQAIIFLFRLCRQYDIEGIYSNTIGIFSGAVTARLRGLPHIWHIHEIVKSPKLLSRFFSFAVPKLSNWVVCNSRSTMYSLVGGLEHQKCTIRVVYNGIEPERFSRADERSSWRLKLQIQPTDVFVCVIGRIQKRKGQEVFLRAAKLVDLYNIVYGVIGGVYDPRENDELHYLRGLSKQLGISERIRFDYFEDGIEGVIQATDIVVVPSTLPESFGLVTIEAMAASKPVIATALGGTLEIVCDGITGYLIPPNDPVSLAEAIRRLTIDPALRLKMGMRGRERVCEQFTLGQFRQKICTVMIDGFKI
jgi:glycosyltransferase involved in cell wall biosynthesis